MSLTGYITRELDERVLSKDYKSTSSICIFLKLKSTFFDFIKTTMFRHFFILLVTQSIYVPVSGEDVDQLRKR